MPDSSHKLVRYSLGALLAFSALNAFGGGYYALAGAEGVPTEWLEGSPFSNYFVPGIILFGVVGGLFLFASISVFSRLWFARQAAFISVAIVFIWLTVQLYIIGYVSWMQPTTAAVGCVIFVLSWLLPKEFGVRK